MPKKLIEASGVVEAFNVSPKGSYEGLLLRNGEVLLQVNFPQEWSTTISDLPMPGGRVQIQAEPEKEKADGHAAHPVYRLIRLSNGDKKSWPPNGSTETGEVHFSGTVERLNFALHGEVNGAILDTGDFLHTKPHGANVLSLTPGLKVKGSGLAKPAVGAHRVIDAANVNGVQLHPKPAKKAHK